MSQMGSVKIVTDSACDIEPKKLSQLGVRVVPLSLRIQEETYDDGKIRGKVFWRKLAENNVTCSSSQATTVKFQTVFDELTADGSSVVAILLSAALSGTYQAAVLAASNLSDRKICVVDSKAASIGYGLMVLKACDLAASGASFDEVRDAVFAMVDRLFTVFSVDSLDYLYSNGRIGRAQHFLGGALGVKPILGIDKDGYVCGLTRVRGKRKVIPTLIELAAEKVPSGSRVNLGVAHGDDPEAADELFAAAKKEWNVIGSVRAEIGGVIGMHAGPGALGLLLLPEND
jgi:DegV family protein with EDD domain